MNAFTPELDIRQLIEDINRQVGDLLLDTCCTAVLNLHHFDSQDQKNIFNSICKSICKLDEDDRLWVAKACKNAYFLLKDDAVQKYFCLLHDIESTLVHGCYDVKLLAELIEQFGRLFKLYPAHEKNKVLKLFHKYLVSTESELILAACEAIEMIRHDLSANKMKQLVASLDCALEKNHPDEIIWTIKSTVNSLSTYKTTHNEKFLAVMGPRHEHRNSNP